MTQAISDTTSEDTSSDDTAEKALEALAEPEIVKAVDISHWMDTLSLSATNQIIVICAIIGLFYLARLYIRRKAKDTKGKFGINLFQSVNMPVQCLFLVSAAMLILRIALPAIADLTITINSYKIALLVLATWLIMRLITFASERVLRKFTREEGNFRARQRYTQIKVIRRIIMVMLIIVMTATGLLMFEGIRTIGVSLLASAGVAGIILGLAAQKTIGNFLVGLQIAFTQPIRLDDVVIVEGEWGWIEEINLTYVVVRIWDKRRLVLPTSYFIEKPFENWTRASTDIIGAVTFHLDYHTPVDEIRAELDRFLDGHELWDQNVKSVQVIETTDKSIILRILVSAYNSPTAWNLRCEVREHMAKFLSENYPESLPKLRASMDEEIKDELTPEQHPSQISKSGE